jgi:serine/threonine protein kinase
MRDRQRPFSEEEIRNFMSQVLHGLNHMHRNGYFHRDLKPGKICLQTSSCVFIHLCVKIFICVFVKKSDFIATSK